MGAPSMDQTGPRAHGHMRRERHATRATCQRCMAAVGLVTRTTVKCSATLTETRTPLSSVIEVIGSARATWTHVWPTRASLATLTNSPLLTTATGAARGTCAC